MKRKLCPYVSLLFLLPLIGEACSNSQVSPASSSKQLGEACDNDHLCLAGLTCEEGTCRIVCQKDSDCKDDQECINQRCVIKTKSDEPTRLLDESCDDKNKCITGLTCVVNVCKKVCSDNGQCPENQECTNQICVDRVPPPPPDREVGESCDDENKCAGGLVCENGTCRIFCQKKEDCAEDQECLSNKCVTIQVEEHNSFRHRGGNLTNVAGKASDGQYKVRVFGGTLSGRSQQGDFVLQAN